jgi:hypothetical protein
MSESGAQAHRQRLLGGTVKVVCKRCNNGWMNRLEEGVRGFLPGMVNGQVVELDAVRQHALAAWSLKTVLMFGQTHRRVTREIIPAEDYSAFHADRRPSRFMAARLAVIAPPSHGPVVMMVDFMCPTFAMPDGELGYIATLRIGYFVVQFLRVGSLPTDMVVSPFAATPHVVPLWPVADRLHWPPPLPLPGRDWEAFGRPESFTVSTQPAGGAAVPQGG